MDIHTDTRIKEFMGVVEDEVIKYLAIHDTSLYAKCKKLLEGADDTIKELTKKNKNLERQVEYYKECLEREKKNQNEDFKDKRIRDLEASNRKKANEVAKCHRLNERQATIVKDLRTRLSKYEK